MRTLLSLALLLAVVALPGCCAPEIHAKSEGAAAPTSLDVVPRYRPRAPVCTGPNCAVPK